MDKGGHEAYHLEASRNFSFSLFTQGTVFSFNDRAVLVINAYGLRAISGGTASGQQGIDGVNKVPLLVKWESVVLGIFKEY